MPSVSATRRHLPGTSTKLTLDQRLALAAACDAAGQLTYVPSAFTTGLLPTHQLTDLTPVGTGTALVAATWGTTQRQNQIIWGQLNPSTTGQSSLWNCALAGPRPDLVAANPSSQGVIRDTSSNVRVWKMQHCYVNPLLWCMPELNPPGGAWDLAEARFLLKDSIGIRGGRFQIEFSEITNVQDPFNIFVSLTSLDTDELVTNGAYRRHNWIHAPLYYKGAGHSQPDGTHSDLDQWSRPQYLTTEYNLFGGPRAGGAGRLADPAYNDGDGSVGSPIGQGQGTMAQQETYFVNSVADPLRYVRNVVHRRNLYWQHDGDGYDINNYYEPAYPNDMEANGVRFTDNLHVRRSDGKAVIRSSQYANIHTGHRWVQMNADGTAWTDDGAVTPING